MNYFESRALEVEKQAFLTSERYYKKIEKIYRESEKNVKSKIDGFYRDFAIENKISYQEARMLLNGSQFKEWRMSIEDYMKLAKESGNENIIKELSTLSKRSQISRLDSLLTQIKLEQDFMFNEQLNLFNEGLGKVYTDSYYRQVYNIQNYSKVYYSFAVVDKELLDKVLRYKNAGKNFSERIWGTHRKKLFSDVQQQIAQGLVTGKGNREIAKDISKRYEVGLHNAKRLVRTESSFYMNEANKDSMKETFIEQYIFLATLDNRTSKICRSLDGKIFKLSEYTPGVNAPVLHPNERSTTAVYIPDIGMYQERVMRNAEGKNVVEGFMSYGEWEKKFV